jgi:hypothetical protein
LSEAAASELAAKVDHMAERGAYGARLARAHVERLAELGVSGEELEKERQALERAEDAAGRLFAESVEIQAILKAGQQDE